MTAESWWAEGHKIGAQRRRTVTRNYVARVNVDGSLDVSFDPNPKYSRAIAVQPDSRILIGGEFSTPPQTEEFGHAQSPGAPKSDGTIDTI